MRTWRVGDVMTRDFVTVGEDTLYREVVDLLTGRRVSAVPVVDDLGWLVGIVTRSDLPRL